MAYSYKRSITIDHTKCGSANSTDFPVLVSFIDATFKTVGNGGKIQNSNGYDINFYSDAALTTTLNYERELFVATTGECIFWVKIPTLSYTSDTVIYIGYGDSGISTDQSSGTSVWNSNYKGVWHFGTPSSANATDSIASGHNGTMSSISSGNGKIGGMASFNRNSNSKIDYSAVITPIGAKTISFWINYADANLNSFSFSFANCTNGNTQSGVTIIHEVGTSRVELQKANPSAKVLTIYGPTTLGNSSWHFFTFTWDGTTGSNKVIITVDGTQYTATANSTESNTPTQNLHLGYYDTTYDFTFYLDELRISDVARSADWITSEYNNQSSPSTFFTLGSEVSNASNTTNFFQFF